MQTGACTHENVPSRLGSLASPETCEPSSRPCSLYEKTYVKFVSVSVRTIQFKPLGVFSLLLYALVIFPSVSVCLIEAEVRSLCLALYLTVPTW